jgi:hypothetical protein
MPEGLHLWRIKADASYSTFPTDVYTTTSANPKKANTSPDGTYTQAAWVDVDLACGPCHGGGSANYITTGTMSSGSANVTVADPTGFATGVRIMIAGAYAGGEDWVTYVKTVAGNVVTVVNGTAAATVTNAVVEVNPTASGLPYYPKAALAAFAGNIHGTKPTAQFSFSYDAATSYQVNFNASLTTCPSGACTYSWDFGDGPPAGSGVTTSHAYSDTTSRTVVLTVDDTVNGTSDTESHAVTPQVVNHPPVAGFTKTFDVNTWTAAVTDISTDPESNIAAGGIRVLWGDGTSSTGNAGAVLPHVYSNAGTFTITLRATDTGSLYNETTQTVSPAAFTISGKTLTFDGAAVSQVLISLKQGATVIANTYTNTSGAYSFASVKPGTYDVTAYKSGVTFAAPTISGIIVGPSNTTSNFATVKTKFKITSTAVGSTGTPISGVTITVKNSANAVVAQGLTNASGIYATGTTLPAGTYSVSASKYGRTFNNPRTVTLTNGGADGTATCTSATP